MPSICPMIGTGRFQWNTGGWFGSQFGCTAWLLVGAASVVAQHAWVAAWWVVCCALANAVGTGLWLRRDRVPPYPAIQALLGACGAGGLLAVAALHLFGAIPDGQHASLRPAYAVLLLGVPAMMGWFALMEWAGRRERVRA